MSLLLTVITAGGFVFDVLQDFYRNEFPYWADSLGIPLAGVPVILIVLFVWSVAHLIFAKNVTVQPLVSAISIKLNPWLMFVSGATFLIVLLSLWHGQYWYAFPGTLWLYYYLSIGVNRIPRRYTPHD